MNAIEKELTEDDYQEFLTEIFGEVELGHLTFDSGEIIRELDPIAFRVGMADQETFYICEECGWEFNNSDDAEGCCKE
jgi:hypothetical protein